MRGSLVMPREEGGRLLTVAGCAVVAADGSVKKAATLGVVRANVVRLDVLMTVTAHHEADSPLVPVNVGRLVSTSKGGLVAGVAEHIYILPRLQR